MVGSAPGRTLTSMSELALPWTPEGRTVRVEGRGEFFVRLHRHQDPAAPTVLLLHGWTASSDLQFLAAYRELAAHVHLVGLDHRGHGRGLRSPDRFELEDVADDAAAVLRTLGIGPVIALGFSMGGPVSLLLARRHPGVVAGLIVQATALEWRATWRERTVWRLMPLGARWLRTRTYRWYLRRAVTRLFDLDNELRPFVPWLVAELSRTDPFAVVEAGQALGRYDARPWAGDLGLPAACLVTTEDRLVRPAKQRALAEALGAEVTEFPADHLATLSEPDAYARLTIGQVRRMAARIAPTPPALPSPSPGAVQALPAGSSSLPPWLPFDVNASSRADS